tara:strand:+ start:2187 stop:3104 length:918 start_codon:yes stop_codon:yes gene_type:complete
MFEVTILITTKDRKDELGVALNSAVAQEGLVEVLVIDDGSSDGTADYVREHFPTVRLVRYEQNLGLIEQRNNGIKLAKSNYVITIDDDAEFTSTKTALRVVECFNEDELAASLALPYCDVKVNPDIVKQVPPSEGDYVISSYRGTAHADRRDVFLKLGGYRGFYYRQGEEGDYCTRLLDHGFYVKVVDAPLIKHYESERRIRGLNVFYSMRNSILYAWYNVPRSKLFVHMVGTILINLKFQAFRGHFLSSVKGMFVGLCLVLFSQFSKRSPVSLKAYSAFRMLRTKSSLDRDELLNYLSNDASSS